MPGTHMQQPQVHACSEAMMAGSHALCAGTCNVALLQGLPRSEFLRLGGRSTRVTPSMSEAQLMMVGGAMQLCGLLSCKSSFAYSHKAGLILK
jgi:hypothetical protein